MRPNESATPKFSIYRGRNRPLLRLGLVNDDGDLDWLAGTDMTLTVRARGADDSEAFQIPTDRVQYDLYPPANPQFNVSVELSATDTDRDPGAYLCHLNITFADGTTQTEPHERFEIRISDPLDDDV